MDKKKDKSKSGSNPIPQTPKPDLEAPGQADSEMFSYHDPFLEGNSSNGYQI